MTNETQTTGYFVVYRNEGRTERAKRPTLEDAERTADFLRFQGATSIRIKREMLCPPHN